MRPVALASRRLAQRARALAAAARGSSGGSGSRAVARTERWTAVTDEQSGGVYYWNKESGETTAVGAPKPTGDVYEPAQVHAPLHAAPASFGAMMVQYAALGGGMAVAMVGVRMLFGL